MAGNGQMQALFEDSFQRCLSFERLDAYRFDLDTQFDRLLRYSWNLKLCESLYIPLQNLEVVLRNKIDEACKTGLRMPNWLSHSSFGLNEKQAIDAAKISVQKQGKSVTHGRIIAELNFSFWGSLFNVIYEKWLFIPVLSSVFVYTPPVFRKRSVISAKLDNIRRLRNRIFHHEPIWKDGNLKNNHNDILEMIYWLDPNMYHYTRALDRFHAVYADGTRPFEKDLLSIACRA